MNREIKFRGKRVDNGEWIVGNLFIPNFLVAGIYICPESNFADFAPTFEDGDSLSEVSKNGCALGHFIEVIPETVGQYTGVKDANDKEVFEGDKDESGYFIQYVDEYACFCYLDKDKAVAWQCVPTFFEQAGTIHD